jgi:TonB family protein
MKRVYGILAALTVLMPMSASEPDSVPVVTFQALPQYPFEMYAKGFPGEVVVDFVVDTKGDVRNAYAVKWTNAGFIPAALAAVSRWKFKPSIKNGKPVNTHLQVPIIFDLGTDLDPAKVTDPEMLYNLGVWFLNGTGRPRNDEKAFDCYHRSAERNFVQAQYALGLMYANGRGVARNPAEGFRWLLKAAESKYSPAQCAVGMAYAAGEYVPKDLATAVSWYRKSAKQKFARAQYLFAICLNTGAGAPMDRKEAAKQLEFAARQNLVAAQVLLGQWYYVGETVPKDNVHAYVWWSLAALTGDKTAKEDLANIEREVSSDQRTAATKLAASISAEFRSTPQ